MNDFLEQSVEIGDRVVTFLPNYREMIRGTVISIAPKTVLIEYQRNGYPYTYRISKNMFVKIDTLIKHMEEVKL